jgi:hypothetical protein
MRITAALTLVLVVLGSVPAVHGQSLADAARKESERRKTQKGPGKVYTNADLKPTAAPPPGDGTATDSSKPPANTAASDTTKGGDTAKAGDATKADTKAGDNEKTEKFWRTRMKDAREQLDRDRVLADALQSRVNALTTDFVNRDDPAQRQQIAADRQRSMAELERLRKAIEADTKAVAALEEEARSKGVPPGWIR